MGLYYEKNMKKFNSVCIITSDLDRSCQFYQRVLQLDPEGDGTFTTFTTQDASLSIFTRSAMEEMSPGCMAGASYGGIVLEFEIDDVDEAYHRFVEMSIPVVKPPTTQPWGLRSVWVRDPDGNVVNFYTDINKPAEILDQKELVRQYFQRLFNERDLSVCDEMLSIEYIDHDSPPTTPPGPESIKEFVRGFIEEYPDIHIKIEDALSENDKIAVRLVWQGHQKGTGKPFCQVGIVFLRVNGHQQLVERWSAYQTTDEG